MKRQEKYPDTEYFIWHNQNPHNRFTTDCVIRAISTATKIPYNQVVMEMAEMQCKTGFDMSENTLINRYLKSKGWVKNRQPRKDDGTKYTGKEFCAALWRSKFDDVIPIGSDRSIIANIGGHHIVAIINWQVWDTWDSTGGCIGNFWTRP